MTQSLMNYPSDMAALVKQAAPSSQLNLSAQALNASFQALVSALGNYLPLAGGTMSGDIDLGTHSIFNAAGIYSQGYGFEVAGSINSNLVSGWHLNASTADYSTYGNNGTWVGSSPSYAAGKALIASPPSPQAANFTGANYIQASDAPLPAGSSPRSIAFWLNTTDSTEYATIFGYGTVGINEQCVIYLNDWPSPGCIGFTQYGNGFDGHTVITDGNWHHVVLTYDGIIATFYIDGIYEASSSAFTVSTVLSGDAMIGNSITNLIGKVQELQVFDISLTPDQIALLWQSGAGYYGLPPTATSPLITYEDSAIQLLANTNVAGSITLTPQSAPASPTAGQIYFDNTSGHFYGYNGSAWVELG